jgi:Flp pilus assembly protein TadB
MQCRKLSSHSLTGKPPRKTTRLPADLIHFFRSPADYSAKNTDMERLAQYLDDLEDVFFVIAFAGEQLRRALRALLILSVWLTLTVLGVLLALGQPPLALAAVTLLLVTSLYRAAVSSPRRAAARS